MNGENNQKWKSQQVAIVVKVQTKNSIHNFPLLSFPKNKNYLALLETNNENEDIEREALKAAQKKLGINTILSKFNTSRPMNMKLESFVTDTIVVQKLKYSGNFNEIARAIKEKLEDQYGDTWSVIITKNWNQTESGSYFYQYAQIQLTYEYGIYLILKST